jgi:DNA-binding beta-propeller fold protein YncE
MFLLARSKAHETSLPRCQVEEKGTIMKNSNTLRIIGAALIAVASVSAHAAVGDRVDLLGAAVSPAQASRTIAVSSKTPYVNVSYGEVVRFDANGKVFAVKFDGVRDTFKLNALAPAGALDHDVRVYVAPTVDGPY